MPSDGVTPGVGRDAVWLSSARVTGLAMGLVAQMILVRYWSMHAYGTYAEVISVVSVAVAFFTLGVPMSLNYFIPRLKKNNDFESFLALYYLFMSGIAVIVGVALTVVLPLIASYYDNPDLNRLWYALAILPWSQIIVSSRSHMLVAASRVRREMVISVSSSLLGLILAGVPVIWQLDLIEYIWVYVGFQTALALETYFEARRMMGKVKIRISMIMFKDVIRFSLPLGVAGAVGVLTLNLNQLMIGYLRGPEDVALYANAGRELPIALVASSITAVLLPKVVRMHQGGETKTGVSLWHEAIVFAASIVFFFAGACIVLAPQAMTFLYSEKYLAGVDVFRVYCLVMICRVTYFGMLLNASGRTRAIMITSIAGLAMSVPLNYILLTTIGIIGPAVSTLLTVIGVNVVQLALSARLTAVSFVEIFPWKRLSILLLINGAASFAVYILVRLVGLGTSARDVGIAIGIGILWTVIYVLAMRRSLSRVWRMIR
jgi:O-antigen/teichoic acid export membrane protein